MDVRVVDHPLARARLSTMRDARTDNAAFRAALRDLTLMLIYEATRDAPEVTAPLHTPVARTVGYRLANPPLLVPVLRAGLGMVDAAQALMPEAQTGFVGIARNEETHQPMPYMESLPSRSRADRCSRSTPCSRPVARWRTRSGCSRSAGRATSPRS